MISAGDNLEVINGSDVMESATIAEYNFHLQAHIDMLEQAIIETDSPMEKEKGRAAIRRLRAGMEGTLKK